MFTPRLPSKGRSRLSSLFKLTLCLVLLFVGYTGPLKAQDNGNNDSRAKAVYLFNEGTRLVKEGSKESLREALTKFAEALKLYREAGNMRGQYTTLLNMGHVNNSLSNEFVALNRFEMALPLVRSLHDVRGEATTLCDIGNIYQVLGEKEKALDYYSKALVLFRRDGKAGDEARPLRDIGVVYGSTGEWGKALYYYLRALAIFKTAEDRKSQARTLGDIGMVYSTLSQRQKALDCFKRALFLSREAGERSIEATILTYLGAAYSALGDKQKGLALYAEALPLFRAIGDRKGQARALNNVGELYTTVGEPRKALDYLGRALIMTRTIGIRTAEARTLTNIGIAYDSIGEKQKALENFAQGLEIYASVKDMPGQSRSLYVTALTERSLGDLSHSLEHIEAALKLVESLRTQTANEEFRSSYFAAMHGYYSLYIDVLMQLHKLHPSGGYDSRALQASEQAHARSLLDALAEAHADIREGVDPALLQRELSLRQELNSTARKQTLALSAEHTPEQAGVIASKINALTVQIQQVEAQIRKTSPRYAALTQPQPLTAREIQTQLLDRETILLAYSLGPDRSYLWAVTVDSIASYELPKAPVIEAAARKVYALLSAPGKWSPNPNSASSDTGAPDAAIYLSQTILAPATSQLGNKRLLIVADGALQYIPFAALPVPSVQSGKSAAYRPLISEHEIVSLPSASTLGVLRRETEGRRPAGKVLAVLADPIFMLDDERLTRGNGQAGVVGHSVPLESDRRLNLGVGVATADSDLAETNLAIPRLLGTRKEAMQILGLAPGPLSKPAMDFDANRTTATSPDIGDYRYVHFATHGFLNSEHPELSGIVLSMYDRNGKAQDGFFRANEVFNLKLSASVVTLSACQTGLGKEIRGEGLVGLTRAFMYAGAPRVVVSLWSVNDTSTAELMTRFYKGMLGESLRPAEALQAAQLSMLKDQKFSSPYYWAPFILQGEWK